MSVQMWAGRVFLVSIRQSSLRPCPPAASAPQPTSVSTSTLPSIHDNCALKQTVCESDFDLLPRSFLTACVPG